VVFANNTYLPNSQKMIDMYEELLFIFWKLLDLNQKFKLYVNKFAVLQHLLHHYYF